MGTDWKKLIMDTQDELEAAITKAYIAALTTVGLFHVVTLYNDGKVEHTTSPHNKNSRSPSETLMEICVFYSGELQENSPEYYAALKDFSASEYLEEFLYIVFEDDEEEELYADEKF